MTELKNGEMEIICNKCGKTIAVTKRRVLFDTTECPDCGTHGNITTRNSIPWYNMKGEVKGFQPMRD